MRELISSTAMVRQIEEVKEDKIHQLVNCPIEEVVEIRAILKGLDIAKQLIEDAREKEKEDV